MIPSTANTRRRRKVDRGVGPGVAGGGVIRKAYVLHCAVAQSVVGASICTAEDNESDTAQSFSARRLTLSSLAT
jgi:hypothetical protein